MNFRQKLLIKLKLKNYKLYVLCVLCGMLSAVCDTMHSGFLPGYRNCVAKITFPIKKYMNEFVETIHIYSNFFNKENLQLMLENKKLKTRLFETEYINKELNNIIKHEKLSKQMIFRVLGFEQNIFNSSLLMEATDEVKPGCIAVSPNGLVGIVTDVANSIAQILTITDKRFSVPVKTKSNVHIIINGNNNNLIVEVAMQQDNQLTTNIKIGDILYTSGEGGVFPCGIPVASITKNHPPIEAKPIVNLDNLEFVKVIKPTSFLN